jgi:hypothetical protein
MFELPSLEDATSFVIDEGAIRNGIAVSGSGDTDVDARAV